MTSMTSTRRVVTVGVDTHSDVHHAAVVDEVGRPLADAGSRPLRPAPAPPHVETAEMRQQCLEQKAK